MNAWRFEKCNFPGPSLAPDTRCGMVACFANRKHHGHFYQNAPMVAKATLNSRQSVITTASAVGLKREKATPDLLPDGMGCTVTVQIMKPSQRNGAGEGNRTLVCSLEDC